MNLLLVRHAVAEEREEFAKTGKRDSERPLTREGREKMRQAAHGVASLLSNLDVIVTSPLKRTVQTARILAAAYTDVDVVRLESLAPDGDHAGTMEWLSRNAHLRSVAMVGHEPSLGELFALLASGRDAPFFEFKKGGVVLLSLGKKPAPGNGRLEWAVQPAALRLISKSKRA